MTTPRMTTGAATDPRRRKVGKSTEPATYAAVKRRVIRANIANAARGLYPRAAAKRDAVAWLMNVALASGRFEIDGLKGRVLPCGERSVYSVIAEAVERGWLHPQEAVVHEKRQQRWIVDIELFLAEGLEMDRARRVKCAAARDRRVAEIAAKFAAFRAANEGVRACKVCRPTEGTLSSLKDRPDSLPAEDAAPADAGAASSADGEDPPAPSGFAATVFCGQRQGGDGGNAPPLSEAQNADPSSPEFPEDLGGCRESLGGDAEFDAAGARENCSPPRREARPPWRRETRPPWSREEVEREFAVLRSADRVSRPAPPPATAADAGNLEAVMGKRAWREDLRREAERRAAQAEERRREEESRRQVSIQQMVERWRIEEVEEWKIFVRRTGWKVSLTDFRNSSLAVR